MVNEVRTISTDLAANLQKMTEVADDKNISSTEKQQKLRELKKVTLSQIAAEISQVGLASQKILENIGRIVEDEAWAKLPKPKELSISLAEAKNIAGVLESIAENSMPDLFELQRLLLESKIKQYATLTDQEILGMNQMVQAAQHEFEKQSAAATMELSAGLTSGILSGVAAAATAGVKIYGAGKAGAKLKSLRGENFSADQATAKRLKDVIGSQEGKLEEANSKLSAVNAKIFEKKSNVAKLKADLENAKLNKSDPSNIAKLRSDLAKETGSLNKLKGQLGVLESDRDSVKAGLDAAKIQHGEARQKIDGADNEAAQYTQKLRVRMDVWDSVAHMVQSGLVKSVETGLEFSAKSLKIDADKEALNKNFAATVQQNAHKDRQDVEEGAKSLLSSIGAIQQTMMSADSHVIRTI